MTREKVYLPQTETEWMQTGKFTLGQEAIDNRSIQYALTLPGSPEGMVVMVGGIPAEPERRQKQPIINKLYGCLALRFLEMGWVSVLYNQPGTGKSTGILSAETLSSMTHTLVELTTRIGSKLSVGRVAFIGMSSGSYMAARASADIANAGFEISSLALQSPAAYPLEAETVPYSPAFTDIISSDWRVESSPVFGDVEEAANKGTKILFSYFQKDNPPIPLHIQGAYWSLGDKLIGQGHNVTKYIISGVEHNFRRMNSTHTRNIVDNNSIFTTAQLIESYLCNEQIQYAER